MGRLLRLHGYELLRLRKVVSIKYLVSLCWMPNEAGELLRVGTKCTEPCLLDLRGMNHLELFRSLSLPLDSLLGTFLKCLCTVAHYGLQNPNKR